MGRICWRRATGEAVSEAARDNSRRHRLTVAAEVATIAAVLVAVVALLVPYLLHRRAAPSGGPSPTVAVQPQVAPPAAASTGRTGEQVFLDRVEPDAGGTNRGG